jgi:predicted ATPase
MRLDELTVGRFKNLNDFHVDFDEGSPYTVLVGENGAGKSNVIEALTLIFRQLDLEGPAPFDYNLKYSCRGSDLHINAMAGVQPTFEQRSSGTQTWTRLTRRRFMSQDEHETPLYRPAFVFGYYSGPSDRLASLYEQHRNRYYNWIIRSQKRRDRNIVDPNVLRRLFFAETLHGQFALIAFFMESDEPARQDQEFLREHLQIDGLESVLFALRRPPWARRKGGDDRFWGAEGEVQAFLQRLYAEALLPARMPRRMMTGIGTSAPVENLYLFLPNQKSLQRVYNTYGNQYAFFTALESTHLSRLLAEVRTQVRMTRAGGGQRVTYRDLSEGEQQLLLILGLLKFTAREEALFLLDEPDTHLNPAWSTQYLDFLGRFIHGRSSCHIVMATHDPLVFSRLERPQVRIIMRGANGEAVAAAPVNDPVGMGIQAILASDLFRLPSGGLDAPTMQDLDTQRRLSMREQELTPEEEDELAEVNRRLGERGYWKDDRDPIYRLFRERFLPRWLERYGTEDAAEPQLAVTEIHEREAVAESLATEIASEIASELANETADERDLL